MVGYIYHIKNTINGKMYIGQTIQYDVRKKTHLNDLKKNKHHSQKLQRAWNKYGEENFIFEVQEYEINNIEELYLLEQEEIKKYDSYFNGYNMTIGGEGIIKKYYTFEEYCFIYFGNVKFEGMMRETAKFLNVDKSVISDIVHGKTYKEYFNLLNSISEEEKQLYINKFIATFGIDINNPPQIRNKLKVDYNILAICKCIMDFYENTGKPLERILGYASGTMSALKREIKYQKALNIYNSYTNEEKKKIADRYYIEWKVLDEKKSTIGAEVAKLTQEEYNIAYAAREEGYGYSCIALYFKIAPNTVKDWFNGRSRKKNLEIYKNLSLEQKQEYHSKIPHKDLQLLENEREHLLRTRNSNRPF